MLCFSMFCVSAGSKSNLAKAAGAEVAVERRHENLHAAVARSTFSIKMRLSLHVRTTFWSWDVEKLRAAVARSAFASQNVQNTAFSEHFLKLRCWKMARRCGEKHILKSKCTKHLSFGPLLEVTMSKNCTPLWREAHFQLKMLKNWRSRTTFWSSDLEKLHAAVARSIFPSQNVQNTCVLPQFFTFRCRKNVLPHSFKFRCLKISQVVS